MALSVTARGTGSRNTIAETSYVLSPTSTIAAGSTAYLAVAYDNSAALGADPFSSISDSLGNTWNQIDVALRNPSSVTNTGCVARNFDSILTTQITSSDTITISFGTNVTIARAFGLWEIDGTKVVRVASTGQVANGNSTTPSVTSSSVANSQLVIGHVSAESNSTITADSDTTNGNWSAQQTSGIGTGITGMSIATQFKIVTGTGTQTYNPTITSSNWATIVRNYQETTASSGLAAGTGAANNPIPFFSASGGLATATGLANNPTANFTIQAGLATATSQAYNIISNFAVQPSPASGTGTAYNPNIPTIIATAGIATATGLANNPTARFSINTGIATGTGTAYNPNIASIIATAGLASGTGQAYNITPLFSVPAGLATATGAAHQPTFLFIVSPSTATGTGTAYNPSTLFVGTVIIIIPPEIHSYTELSELITLLDNPVIIVQEASESITGSDQAGIRFQE